jgi:hypothetical protein
MCFDLKRQSSVLCILQKESFKIIHENKGLKFLERNIPVKLKLILCYNMEMQIVFIVLALVTMFPTMLCGAGSYSLSVGIDDVKLCALVAVPSGCNVD